MTFKKDLKKYGYAIVKNALSKMDLQVIKLMDTAKSLEYCCAIPKVRYHFNILYNDMDLCFDDGKQKRKMGYFENTLVWDRYYYTGLLCKSETAEVWVGMLDLKLNQLNAGDILFIDPSEITWIEGDTIGLPLKPKRSFK
jgi:hypothetical protein